MIKKIMSVAIVAMVLDVCADISQIGNQNSEIVAFIADVNEASTVTITPYNPGDAYTEQSTFDEGESVVFKIRLSEKNDTGSTIYAYLRPSDNVTAGMFEARGYPCVIGMDNPVGCPINKDSQECLVDFLILDGQAAPGAKYTFSVVLSSDENWDGQDETKIINGYGSNSTTITVYNVEPRIKCIEKNGLSASNDGYVFPRAVITGEVQAFQAVVEDVENDLMSDFKTKWTVYFNDNEMYSEIITGNPNDKGNAYSCTFTGEGSWTVKCQIKDGDMEDWCEQTYFVGVKVVQPVVELKVDDSYMETDCPKSIEVALNYFLADEIVVKVIVTPPSSENPGAFVIDPSYKTVPDGYSALGDNEYYIRFNSTEAISIDIVSMDGTNHSATYGFEIKAEVVTPKWSSTYLPATSRVYIKNVPPVVDFVTTENVESWLVVGGVASKYPIQWSVSRDSDADFTAGIKVSFYGPENSFTTNINDAASGSFVPDFGYAIGQQTVTMTIEDKDGGYVQWEYLYDVMMPPNVVVEVDGSAIDFKTASDGKTRTMTVADGATVEDVKIFVDDVDVTAGFRIAVEGTTAFAVLRKPYEQPRIEDSALYHENDDNETVTLNIKVVPGLYYAASSASTLENLKCPKSDKPASEGDLIVVPKQVGTSGFYKVWVSDAPFCAE